MYIRIILVTFFLTMACKREDSTPELRDPIFGSIVRSMEEAQRKQESIKRELEEAKKDLETAGIQNGEIKVRRQAVFDKIQELDAAAQKTKYLELQAETRKMFARREYKKAFLANKEWPDPEEFRLYKIHQKLVSIPKSYDETHLNRIESRKPASKENEKKPKAH